MFEFRRRGSNLVAGMAGYGWLWLVWLVWLALEIASRREAVKPTVGVNENGKGARALL